MVGVRVVISEVVETGVFSTGTEETKLDVDAGVVIVGEVGTGEEETGTRVVGAMVGEMKVDMVVVVAMEAAGIEVIMVGARVVKVLGARVVVVLETHVVPLHMRSAEQHSSDVQHVVPAGQHTACDRHVTLFGPYVQSRHGTNAMDATTPALLLLESLANVSKTAGCDEREGAGN